MTETSDQAATDNQQQMISDNSKIMSANQAWYCETLIGRSGVSGVSKEVFIFVHSCSELARVIEHFNFSTSISQL